MRRLVLLLLAAMPGRAHAAAPVVISAAPDRVAVTIYRDPERTIERAIDLQDLRGFAVISETRTVRLPPGVATIRFEGVASGIVPQSALIFGAGVREKNRDAALLSQRGLLDSFTGQRVTLRRTDRATGKTIEESALLRSSANGVVVQTARGIEPVYCSGLAETLLFPGVPRTLSAKPVLSMTTKRQPGGLRTITLVYLSSQFDWQANYVGQFNADATALDLFAWLTMASNDDTSFMRASAAAVAGKVNRVEDSPSYGSETDDGVSYNCGTEMATFDVAEPPAMAGSDGAMVAFRMSAPMPVSALAEDIVVTGARRATLENLGDLKRYVIPMPVTVAARAQKQVAFLVKPRVTGALIYRVQSSNDLGSVQRLFRFRNTKANGLGDALPAGNFALFQQAAGQRMLVGEAAIVDKTVDEDVDLLFGAASNVTSRNDGDEVGSSGTDAKGHDWDGRVLKVSNANPHPINFEAEFATADDTDYSRFSGMIVKRPGKTVWVVSVPANGSAELRYRATSRE